MLTSKQRSYLRSLANNIESIIQIGKNGVDESVIKQVDEALTARELIKLNTLKNCPLTSKEACEDVCAKVSAEEVQVIGSKFIIYRESKDNSSIKLPSSES